MEPIYRYGKLNMNRNDLLNRLFIHFNFMIICLSFVILSYIKINDGLCISGTFISIWHFYFCLKHHKIGFVEFIIKYCCLLVIMVLFYYFRFSRTEILLEKINSILTFCKVELLFIFTSLLFNKLFTIRTKKSKLNL